MPIDISTPEALTAAAGLLISVIFTVVPSVRAWFTSLDADQQSATVGGIILLVAVLAVIGSCTGAIPFLPCTKESIFDYFVKVVFSAVIGVAVSRGVFNVARLGGKSPTDPNVAETKSLQRAARPKLLD